MEFPRSPSDVNCDGLWQLSARELSAGYRNRTFSPVEVTAAVLGRIEEKNPDLNAMCHVGPEDAMSAAVESERRWQRGECLGPLDGVPVTIKDFFSVRGWPTRRGSRLLASAAPDDSDAPAVARLREAGAVIIGKTATTEFGHKASSISPLTGTTRNPWNQAWSSGGSSCGAAAAAAAGLGPIHLGSDAAGSIRIPASFCGVYGHKPTSGLVPAYPPSASGHLAAIGPIARNVADARLMLDAITQPEPTFLDATEQRRASLYPGEITTDRLRLAMARGINDCAANGGVLERLRGVAASLEKRGVLVEEIDLQFDGLLAQFRLVWHVFVATSAKLFRASDLDLAEPSMARMIVAGRRISAVGFNAALLFLAELTFRLNNLFRRFDGLLLPTLPFPAFAAEAEYPSEKSSGDWLSWAQTCFLFNATKMPASSVPCGFVEDGKPVGVQVVGPIFSDARVMSIAELIEETVPVPTLVLD